MNSKANKPVRPSTEVWAKLKHRVIAPGLCTHCGTCVGLSTPELTMASSSSGPVPKALGPGAGAAHPYAYEACPGKGLNYPDLYQHVFGSLPESWLIGPQKQLFVGHSTDEALRQNAASGGIITQVLVHLLHEGFVDGAVVVVQGRPEPWSAEPVLATSEEEILSASQSVYVPVPVNTILAKVEAFPGRLAYVGLPDQVSSIRQLQALGHGPSKKIEIILGPYVGTYMYFEAIESFLSSNGVFDLNEVVRLKYREGEWPGHLCIELGNGRLLTADKFYYNYLIPFFVTNSSLMSVDFTNELTDISVGDAWHPRYEKKGGGYSAIIARSENGLHILEDLRHKKRISLEKKGYSMHAHMIEFKKRGAFIRMGLRKKFGKAVPEYGYQVRNIPQRRTLIELCIMAIFAVCRTRTAKRLLRQVPIRWMGPLFNHLRISWKRISKPGKREGLLDLEFEIR